MVITIIIVHSFLLINYSAVKHFFALHQCQIQLCAHTFQCDDCINSLDPSLLDYISFQFRLCDRQFCIQRRMYKPWMLQCIRCGQSFSTENERNCEKEIMGKSPKGGTYQKSVQISGSLSNESVGQVVSIGRFILNMWACIYVKILSKLCVNKTSMSFRHRFWPYLFCSTLSLSLIGRIT